MNKYQQGILYIGTIKRNRETIKENVLIFYSKQKDIFYDIEVLNEVHDIESNENISSELILELEKKVKNKTYSYHEENNDDNEYIDENTIRTFEETIQKTETRENEQRKHK